MPEFVDVFERMLAPASYEGVHFPVVSAEVTGGHDSAKHEAFRVAGADIETTGRKPTVFTLKIPLFHGLAEPISGWEPDDVFPGVYRRLLAKFRDEPLGLLVHPTRGRVTVHVDEVKEHLAPDARSGVTLEVTFTEHVASAPPPRGLLAGDPIESLQVAFAALEAARPSEAQLIEAVRQGASPIVLDIPSSLLDGLEQITRRLVQADGVLRDVSAATRAGIALVNGNLTEASFAGLVGHEYRLAAELAIGAFHEVREAAMRISQPRTYDVPEEMSVAEIAAQPAVYGDPSAARFLLAANRIPDPLRVPAGTTLVVPPLA